MQHSSIFKKKETTIDKVGLFCLYFTSDFCFIWTDIEFLISIHFKFGFTHDIGIIVPESPSVVELIWLNVIQMKTK